MNNILPMLGTLAIVLPLLLALLYCFRKAAGSSCTDNDFIRIISELPVGTKERILVLEVNDTTLIVGVTAQQMNLLHVIEESTLVENPAYQKPALSLGS
ncbi:MAG: flagellar biosynthetic protein FliO [Legionellaceae bacterium]|nr:flagellar biosynthetic protein FliO [Legionellaceae bacterium]